MIEPTSPKFRVLKPNKLEPPLDVTLKIKQKKKESFERIGFVKFILTFFGEGF